uniref:Uncharacterized protein n=1 Tax=Arundo donax TaxID=35708 RepID=A0A0A9GKJ3_ARUDO
MFNIGKVHFTPLKYHESPLNPLKYVLVHLTPRFCNTGSYYPIPVLLSGFDDMEGCIAMWVGTSFPTLHPSLFMLHDVVTLSPSISTLMHRLQQCRRRTDPEEGFMVFHLLLGVALDPPGLSLAPPSHLGQRQRKALVECVQLHAYHILYVLGPWPSCMSSHNYYSPGARCC